MTAEVIWINEETLVENFKSKWLKFKITRQKGKTVSIAVGNLSEDCYLGQIEWYGPFRKYSFFPSGNCVFEVVCLSDIRNFLIELEAIRKNRKPFLVHKVK